MHIRIGHGFDVHAFGNKGPLIIGGVKISFLYGFIAHSDGDVVLHALMNALLGAMAMGDIGQLFPNTDPSYYNVDSRILLRKVCKMIKQKKYFVGNVDITIIAQRPMMASYIPSMRKKIAQDLNSCINHISIKACTTEKLGFIGRSEGIACEAVVLLFKYHQLKQPI